MATSTIPARCAKDMFKSPEVVNEANTSTDGREATPKSCKKRSRCSCTWLCLVLVTVMVAVFGICAAAFLAQDPVHNGKTPAHYSVFKDLRAAEKYAGLEALRARRVRTHDMNIRWVNFFEDEPTSTSFETTSSILQSLDLHDKANQAATRNTELANNKLREVEVGAMKILFLATTRFAEAETAAAISHRWKNSTLTWLYARLSFECFAPYAPATQAKVLGQETQIELARFINSHTDIFAMVDIIDKRLEAEFHEFGAFLSLVRVEWTQPLGAAVCRRAKLQETCTRADIARASDKEVHDRIKELLTKGKEEYLVDRQNDREFVRAMFIGLDDMARFYDNPIRVENLDDLWMVLQQLTDKLVALVMVDEDGDRKLVR
ncbi:hypothetical protein BKA63DRAFT_573093 [Paraphoma chrysanthemicola]|nr:hypothetical protein BKA63DRAFT_573093 [Paraphoma chrysanthemicola]